jgi:hypothetical protein
MGRKGVGELQGLTAQEIWDAHFRNELDEESETETVWQAAGFLAERGYDVWEYRETGSRGTVWQDGLSKFWLVDHTTEDINELDE